MMEELRDSSITFEAPLEHPLSIWLSKLNIGTLLEPDEPIQMTALISHGGMGLELGFTLTECNEFLNRKLNMVAQTIWVPSPLVGYTEYSVTRYHER